MRFLKNLSLFISAFIPMYFLIDLKLLMDIINENLSWNILNTIMFVGLILLIGFGAFGVYWNVRLSNFERMHIVLKKQTNITDQHFFGYFSLFVLFAVSFDLSKICMVCVFVVILVLIGIVYMKNSLYYINPFLNILGFNFYEIEFVEVGKETIRHAKMFYKGELKIGKSYFVKLKNENFTFIDSDKK